MDVLLFTGSALLVTLIGKTQKKRASSNNNTRAQEEEAAAAAAALRQALRDKQTLNAQERICLVTADNEVLPDGGGLRADMRLHNLWHRATYILVHHRAQHLPRHERHADDYFHAEYILVQKRTLQKDYCPGKLDPTPGGVVGLGETYRENAQRELEEEFGMLLSDDNKDDDSSPSLDRLFTFSYQDDHVRVWGDFYECTYTGALHDLVLQETEVAEVIRMSLRELGEKIETQPEEFMPDSVHAMKLYFQRRGDFKVQRRLLKGYSSGDIDSYALRTKPQVLFFDCDDCLYFDKWKTAQALTDKIEEWCVNHGLRPGQAYELYKQYGTALQGLLAEGYLEENDEAIDKYLQDVHDIPIASLLSRDDELRSMLLRMDRSIPKYIFTASVREHAVRCLQALGIEDLFVDIIDCKCCSLETKHSPHSFRVAMSMAGVENPEACLFLDDSLRNIQAARHVGWRSVLVGKVGRDCGQPVSSEHAELEIDRIHELPHVLPELFVKT